MTDYDRHFHAGEALLCAQQDCTDSIERGLMIAAATAHFAAANAAANRDQALADARTASAVSIGDEFAEGRLQVGGVR